MSGFDDLFLGMGGEQDFNKELRRVFFFFTLQSLCLEQQFNFAPAFGFGQLGRGRVAMGYGPGRRLVLTDRR